MSDAQKSAEQIVSVSGYAAILRRGNNHKVWDIHPRVYGKRKDLIAAFPWIARPTEDRKVIRVTVTQWEYRIRKRRKR